MVNTRSNLHYRGRHGGPRWSHQTSLTQSVARVTLAAQPSTGTDRRTSRGACSFRGGDQHRGQRSTQGPPRGGFSGSPSGQPSRGNTGRGRSNIGGWLTVPFGGVVDSMTRPLAQLSIGPLFLSRNGPHSSVLSQVCHSSQRRRETPWGRTTSWNNIG